MIDANLPHGTFPVKTQDGDCEYKNNRKGNPGALWYSSQVHGCVQHLYLTKGKEANWDCRELGYAVKRSVQQRMAVVCKW